MTAMPTAIIGEVAPYVAGSLYCSMIDACRELADIRRAQEWTAALTTWCDQQPNMFTFSGQCLVHRAEIMQLRGQWPAAVDEAKRACERFAHAADQYATGMAWYWLAEIYRAQGSSAEAGRRTAVPASGDDETAAIAAEELTTIAGQYGTTVLRAEADRARWSVRLAAADARTALAALRDAWQVWRDLNAPYEAAKVRVLIGQACRALGDEDSAALELDSARRVFAQVGAGPDLARLDALTRHEPDPAATHGLTARELQVLRLLASGKTNHAIAADLVLADKTVGRHVSSIFTKLGVNTRAAATAYAYQHRLVRSDSTASSPGTLCMGGTNR